MTTSSFLFGLYCDDIRQEVGNKQTLVGIYTGNELIFNGPFPAALPKLCVQATFVYPAGNGPEDVTIRVLLDSNILVETKIPREVLGNKEPVEPRDDDSPPRRGVTANMILGPIAFQTDAVMRLEAVADGVRYFGPRLKIRSTGVAGEPEN